MTKLEKELHNMSNNELIDFTLELIEGTYTLIEWPESQKYLGKKGITAYVESSVFVPTKKLYK